MGSSVWMFTFPGDAEASGPGEPHFENHWPAHSLSGLKMSISTLNSRKSSVKEGCLTLGAAGMNKLIWP